MAAFVNAASVEDELDAIAAALQDLEEELAQSQARGMRDALLRPRVVGDAPIAYLKPLLAPARLSR